MKSMKCKLLLCSAISLVAGAGLVLAAESYFLQHTLGGLGQLTGLLRVSYILNHSFHGEVNSEKMLEGAVKGMVESLDDPYTVYLDKSSMEELKRHTEGTFGGIGIIFGKHKANGQYQIMSVIEDNPGAKAGLKVGEYIVAVNGESVNKMNIEQVSQLIRGPEGTEVELEIAASSGEKRKVKITRSQIKNPSLKGTMLDNKLAYIRIAMFNDETGADFKKEYQRLEAEGMKALILDLRGNPGGTLKDGVAVAEMLVPAGPIVSVMNKQGESYTEEGSGNHKKYPLAVLVDRGTASAAEIVAGAVKDTKSGRLIGEKTFGKGSVQSVYSLDKDRGLKITIARYFTPSGVSIHKIGIEPDEAIALPEDGSVDTQLEAAKAYLLKLEKEEQEAGL